MLSGSRSKLTVLCARQKLSARQPPRQPAAQPTPQTHVVGIDLGTTNSAVAVIPDFREAS